MSIFVNTAAQNNTFFNDTVNGNLEYLFGECVATDFDAGANNVRENANRNALDTLNESSVWQRFVVDNNNEVINEEECTAFDGQRQRRVRCGTEPNFTAFTCRNSYGFKRSNKSNKSKSKRDFTTTTTKTERCFMSSYPYVCYLFLLQNWFIILMYFQSRSTMSSVHCPGHSIIGGPGLPIPPPQELLGLQGLLLQQQ